VSDLSIARYFPWRRMRVISQSVSDESKSALVKLAPDRRFRPLCHRCGQPGGFHSWTRKFVRDRNFGDYTMLLHIEYRKLRCRQCRRVHVERLDFVDTSQRVTMRLGTYAAELCRRGLAVETVADHLDLDPKTVKQFDKQALTERFGQTDYDGLERIAIDEIAVKKGHHYMTVVLDYDSGRVVWMGKGRQIATLDGFFENMPGDARDRIQAVALDMHEPYIQAVAKWCPSADIVFDRFHVVKAFNKVIDDIRNEESRKADAAGRKTLKGSKYLFLKNWGNLKRKQRGNLREILALNERLNTVYWLKDLLKHIWDYHLRGWAEGALDEWCLVAREDGHPALLRFAKTLERHSEGIMNHCKHQIHTSKLEGVNNKIKLLKRVAYGYRDLEYFALKVKQAFPGRESCN